MIAQFSTQTGTFMDKLDPRVKIFFTIEILILIAISDTFLLLLIPMVLPILLTIYVNGIKSILEKIWTLKWYFILFFVFGILFIGTLSLHDLIFVFIKFLVLYLSFIALSRTTSPDQITDGLIKLKFPTTISWAIGITMRQVYFIFNEIANIREIHRLKMRAKDIERSRFQHISDLIISIYSSSIIRAEMFSKSLKARGFDDAHPTIITYSEKFGRSDLIFFLISTLPLITFIILSSQVFNS